MSITVDDYLKAHSWPDTTDTSQKARAVESQIARCLERLLCLECLELGLIRDDLDQYLRDRDTGIELATHGATLKPDAEPVCFYCGHTNTVQDNPDARVAYWLKAGQAIRLECSQCCLTWTVHKVSGGQFLQGPKEIPDAA